jgi:hypothetical protein
VPERSDSLNVSLSLDLSQEGDGFCLGVFDDQEPIDGEMYPILATQFRGAGLDVYDLFLEPFERVPVYEIVITSIRTVLAGINRVSALEDERVGTAREVEWFGRQGIVVELVEIAFVGEFLGGPDPLETFDEFSAASKACELCEM